MAARVAAICNGGERLSRGDQLILQTAVSQDPPQTPRGGREVLPQGNTVSGQCRDTKKLLDIGISCLLQYSLHCKDNPIYVFLF